MEDKNEKVTELKSISADYKHNPKDEVNLRKKFDFGARKYDYPDDRSSPGKGYSFYHHDVFENSVDEAFANHSFVSVNKETNMSDISVNQSVDTVDLVLFTAILAPNGKYLKSVGDKIYAITEQDEVLTDKNMFKIYRSVRSGVGHGLDDKGYVISQGLKFATVKMFMNRFNLELHDLILGDSAGIQHFGVYQIPGTNRITMYSLMKDPWRAKIKTLDDTVVNSGLAYDTVNRDVHRFVSIYDAASTDVYPKGIYEGENQAMVKIIGNIYNDRHKNIDTLKRIGNNYLFKVEFPDTNGDRYIMIGYDGKVRWVKYFNEFYDKFFNADVTPDKIIESIKPSVLFESPYKTSVNGDEIEMNFVELKNVMTPGYEYGVFNK